METKTDYITPQEVSQITGICVTNVYSWIKQEQFPSVQIESKFYIPKSAFLKWWQDPAAIIAYKAALKEQPNE